MKRDFEIKTAISQLKKSLDIIEKLRHRTSIYEMQAEHSLNLDLLKYYITGTLIGIKNNFLLAEEDFCSLENLLEACKE